MDPYKLNKVPKKEEVRFSHTTSLSSVVELCELPIPRCYKLIFEHVMEMTKRLAFVRRCKK